MRDAGVELRHRPAVLANPRIKEGPSGGFVGRLDVLKGTSETGDEHGNLQACIQKLARVTYDGMKATSVAVIVALMVL